MTCQHASVHGNRFRILPPHVDPRYGDTFLIFGVHKFSEYLPLSLLPCFPAHAASKFIDYARPIPFACF